MGDFPAGWERLLKQRISNFRCGVCRRTFDRERVRIAAKHDQVWIVSVRCSLCRNQQVFWVLPSGKDQPDDGILRDVTDAEEEYFAEMDPVAADEVLDMHEFLADFDGDFKRFFGG